MATSAHARASACIRLRPAAVLPTSSLRVRSSMRPPRPVVARSDAGTAVQVLTDAYNQQMAKQMNWSDPFQYHFDRGLYFHEVHPNLICGTQPRNPHEVRQLAREHNVQTILNLQQDKDMQYWNIDFEANRRACRENGINLVRRPARDFDPDSLRNMLPGAVRAVAEALEKGDRVYVHCTAGLGRAPAVCIAYIYWFSREGLHLDTAYDQVTQMRPCGPKKDAVRGATYDLLKEGHVPPFEHLPGYAYTSLTPEERMRVQQRVQSS